MTREQIRKKIDEVYGLPSARVPYETLKALWEILAELHEAYLREK